MFIFGNKNILVSIIMGILVNENHTVSGLTVSNFYVNVMEQFIMITKLSFNNYSVQYSVSFFSDTEKTCNPFFTERIVLLVETTDDLFTQIYSDVVSKYEIVDYTNC